MDLGRRRRLFAIHALSACGRGTAKLPVVRLLGGNPLILHIPSGKQSADDIMLMSKECCIACIKKQIWMTPDLADFGHL